MAADSIRAASPPARSTSPRSLPPRPPPPLPPAPAPAQTNPEPPQPGTTLECAPQSQSATAQTQLANSAPARAVEDDRRTPDNSPNKPHSPASSAATKLAPLPSVPVPVALPAPKSPSDGQEPTDAASDIADEDDFLKVRKSVLETVVVQQQKRIAELERKIRRTKQKIVCLQSEAAAASKIPNYPLGDVAPALPTDSGGALVTAGPVRRGDAIVPDAATNEEVDFAGAPINSDQVLVDAIAATTATATASVAAAAASAAATSSATQAGFPRRPPTLAPSPTTSMPKGIPTLAVESDTTSREFKAGMHTSVNQFLANGLPHLPMATAGMEDSSAEAMPRFSPSEGPGDQKQTRYWTAEEHERFLQATHQCGDKNYVLISKIVGTRTPKQVRTHAQKYQKRLEREAAKRNGVEIPFASPTCSSLGVGDTPRMGAVETTEEAADTKRRQARVSEFQKLDTGAGPILPSLPAQSTTMPDDPPKRPRSPLHEPGSLAAEPITVEETPDAMGAAEADGPSSPHNDLDPSIWEDASSLPGESDEVAAASFPSVDPPDDPVSDSTKDVAGDAEDVTVEVCDAAAEITLESPEALPKPEAAGVDYREVKEDCKGEEREPTLPDKAIAGEKEKEDSPALPDGTVGEGG